MQVILIFYKLNLSALNPHKLTFYTFILHSLYIMKNKELISLLENIDVRDAFHLAVTLPDGQTVQGRLIEREHYEIDNVEGTHLSWKSHTFERTDIDAKEGEGLDRFYLLNLPAGVGLVYMYLYEFEVMTSWEEIKALSGMLSVVKTERQADAHIESLAGEPSSGQFFRDDEGNFRAVESFEAGSKTFGMIGVSISPSNLQIISPASP